MSDTLVGSEGGRWIVTTEGSTHHFDLDNMTVTRIPGRFAAPNVNDQTRPIRSIVLCKIGERGFWTMYPDDEDSNFLNYFWHFSSRILHIEPAPPDPAEETDS